MGNFIWIFIGTTTFVGLIIFLGNLVMGGEINKKFVRKLITLDNNLNIDVSDPGFKATWKDGMIKFHNVKVRSNKDNNVEYVFDVNTINLTLSLNKWLDGHGLIKDMNISGLTGEIQFPDDQHFIDMSFDDSYILNGFKLNDSHIMMKGKMFKKPFELNIFTCEMEKLRRPWFLYDFLNADALSGSFNGSLFTLHKRQNRYAHFVGMDSDEHENNPWKKITRVRINQMDLKDVFTDESKLNWITSGKAELTVDVMLPNEEMSEVKKGSLWERVVAGSKRVVEGSESVVAGSQSVVEKAGRTTPKYVVMDFKVSLYDLRASSPKKIPRSSLTNAPYISEDDLQSLITFINDKKFGLASGSSNDEADTDRIEGDTDVSPFVGDNTIPPLKFRVVQNLQTFNYIDFPSMISLCSKPVENRSELGEKQLVSFVHTNQFIDSLMSEALSLLLLYKEETRLNLIRKYSQRSGVQIFFNNSAVGNLLLVGLGSFVI
ncbi:hypothetical protein FOA43_002956 [Brettanomyces nanus]|uniref:Uncharacterized protein n=1 Tax=Eeniella nana TaxID=13502 RepID=A0A875S7B1_EENNA|nr:uncharacterized protein FOA43_002956 [Brettanomyces nanus]QPG75599.1 hypothetical protein FOA43_002956 [Brettanomyces nanus]